MSRLKIELMTDLSDVEKYIGLYLSILETRVGKSFEGILLSDAVGELRLNAIMNTHEELETAKSFLANLYNLVYDVNEIHKGEQSQQLEFNFGD